MAINHTAITMDADDIDRMAHGDTPVVVGNIDHALHHQGLTAEELCESTPLAIDDAIYIVAVRDAAQTATKWSDIPVHPEVCYGGCEDESDAPTAALSYLLHAACVAVIDGQGN